MLIKILSKNSFVILRVRLDGRKWRERKGRDLEGERIPYLDSNLEGKGFGGKGIGRI